MTLSLSLVRPAEPHATPKTPPEGALGGRVKLVLSVIRSCCRLAYKPFVEAGG